jgi:hypothetical protein
MIIAKHASPTIKGTISTVSVRVTYKKEGQG